MQPLLEAISEPYRPWVELVTWSILAIAVTWMIHGVLYGVLGRLASRTTGVADTSALRHTRASARMVLMLLAVRVVLSVAPSDHPPNVVVQQALDMAIIAAVTWLAVRALSVLDDVIMSRFPTDVSDNLRARQVHTQVRVLTRTAMVIVATVGVSVLLMTLPAVRQFGASLLASAGVAGLVIGLAARPALSNIIAGIQLALAQPIRLDDVVIVQGEWGRIEEVTMTYVVVRIWDQRRLIVPLGYFIEHPFENWTRTTADILGTVFIYADYTVSIPAVRQELERIVQDCPQWDRRVCGLQVTNTTDRTVELRALVSSADASAAWDLRCIVREKLVEFLQRQQPDCLPKTRAQITTSTSHSAGEGPSPRS